MAYLQEKNDLMQKWKMEEMQLQKQRLEDESKRGAVQKATSGFDTGHTGAN